MIEFLASLPAGLWVFLGTCVGTIGLAWWNRYLAKSEHLSTLRKDFLEEINACNLRIDKLEEEVDAWRQRAYQAEEAVAALRKALIDYGHSFT